MIVEGFKEGSHGFEVCFSERDGDIEFFEGGDIEDIFAELIGLAVGVGLKLEVVVLFSNISPYWEKDGVVEDALSFEAGFFVDVHSVECGQLDGGF